MMITSVSVIMTVIVINIHYRGPSNRFLPHSLRRFLLIHVMNVNSEQSSHSPISAFVPSVHTNGKDPMITSESKSSTEVNTPSSALLTDIEMKISSSFGVKSNSEKLNQRNSYYETSLDHHHKSSQQPQSTNYTKVKYIKSKSESSTYSFSNQDSIVTTEASSSGSNCTKKLHKCKCINCHKNTCDGKCKCCNSSSSVNNRLNRETLNQMLNQTDESLQILRYLLCRHKYESDESKTISEWRLLALAVDKILFWVFFVIIIFSSVFFLIIIPARKRGVSFIFS